MNLEPLFEAQKALDERIIAQKGLQGVDLWSNKLLALAVEVGELANAWRGFKHWSTDQNPRLDMLEEYVDCLHFLLSIGLDMECRPWIAVEPIDDKSRDAIIDSFNTIFNLLSGLWILGQEHIYSRLLREIVNLGVMLGFSWEEVEEAYFRKNKINHERQDNGY